MNTTGLEKIFILLPQKDQQEAILTRLEIMFAEGQWGELEKILPAILNLENYPELKARALLVKLKCALRLRKFDEAFDLYEQIVNFRDDANMSDIKAQALFQIACQMLPEKSEQIFACWRELVLKQSVANVQEELKDVGRLLADTFKKMGTRHF